MGFLSRFEKVPSTMEDSAVVAAALQIDTEQQGVGQVKSGNDNANGIPFHVTPEMEKRVVRKLDKRLVPLVTGLCIKLLPSSFIMLTNPETS
jgi:hypothetical protein